MKNRLGRIADQLPGVFKTQEELEHGVNGEIIKAWKTANQPFLKDRLKLAPLLAQYDRNASILMVLWYEQDNAQAYQYLEDNRIQITESLRAYRRALESIRNRYDQKQWPVGKNWMKYTRLGYAFSDVDHLLDAFKISR